MCQEGFLGRRHDLGVLRFLSRVAAALADETHRGQNQTAPFVHVDEREDVVSGRLTALWEDLIKITPEPREQM